MNISNTALNNTVAVNSKPHSVVNELQTQKNDLIKQIQKVNEGTGDSKTKAEKVKTINTQIEELNKQIQQAQIDEKQKELEEMQRKNAEKAEEKYKTADDTQTESVILSASLTHILAAKNGYADVKDLSRVRTKLIGEAKVAEGQVKYGTGSVTYQMGVLEQSGGKIAQIEGKMAKKMGEVDRKLHKSVNQGINEAEKARANKQDQVEGQEQKEKTTSNEVDSNGEVQVTSVDMPVVDASRVIIMAENEKDTTTEKSDINSKAVDILA